MIYTVSLNPAIDYHIWLPSLRPGEITGATKDLKISGGKGINVSKVLKNLGESTTACGFIGGFTGEFIQKEMNDLHIPTSFIEVEGATRINVKLKAEEETDISGVSPIISEKAFMQLLKQMKGLTHTDQLILAGSVPKGLPEDTYEIIMDEVKAKGLKVALDTSGIALKQGIRKKPFLIKPNHHELGELFEVTINTPEEAIHYAKQIVEQGVTNVIVSLAGNGAVLVNQEAAYIATFPKSKPVNSIGAGDSVVAGFMHAVNKNLEQMEAFRFAVACGTATALSEGLCTPDSIKEIIPTIQVSNI
ncbi:1-phosphofructokinase [Brevibacillus daliensis]|uniref:1-phosphofructokinase n=1 Tax=Brevibacillus daliensis TaxID=2892995 RepID=UPI001E421A1D|nr:1-phosphofructokinase [Brevibacillus daliensis]